MAYEIIEKLLEVISKDIKNEKGFKFKTLLEIGCGGGYFVEELRGKGIMAEGIDLIPRRKYQYIYKADARNLKSHYKNRKFDVIVANAVLCNGAQLEALMITDRKKAKEPFERNLELFHKNSIDILKSCYGQLNSPGVFINSEQNYLGIDKILYDKKEIEKIGFSAFIFKEQGTVLLKN